MTTEPNMTPSDDEPSLMRAACYPPPDGRPLVSKDPLFDSAEYYDWRDNETLQHECVEAVLEDWADLHYEKGVNIREMIAQNCPVEITAYKRDEIDERHRARMGASLADSLAEFLAEDFGDMDGDIPGWSKDVERDVASEFAQLIERLFEKHKIHSWRCEPVATRILDASEVETILRAENPDWFEEDAG